MCTILGHPFCILVVFHGQLRQTCESLWRLVLGMTSRQELREPALGQVWSSPLQTAQVWEIWVVLCTIRELKIPRTWNLQTKNVMSSKKMLMIRCLGLLSQCYAVWEYIETHVAYVSGPIWSHSWPVRFWYWAGWPKKGLKIHICYSKAC